MGWLVAIQSRRMAKSSTVQSPDVWLLEPMIVQDAVGLERGWRVDAQADGACLNSSKLPVAGVGAVANNELDGHAD